MIKKSFKYIGVVLVSSIGFLSCEKNDEGSMNGAGRTIVKIDEASDEKYTIALDFVTGFQEVNLITVRRNVPNNSELNKDLNVVITEDQTILDEYNSTNGTEYEALPADSYTIDAGNPKSGSDWTLKFNSGEFAKPVKINFDASKIDLSKQYAFAFKLKDAAGNAISNAYNTVIVEVGVKNKYDGVYEVTGTMVDNFFPNLTGDYPVLWELRTTGSSTVDVYDKLYQFPLHSIRNNGAWSYYGQFAISVEFDNATGEIKALTNPFKGSLGRDIALDESGENRYDEATKTVKIKYFMTQPGFEPYRTSFNETWVYKGAR